MGEDELRQLLELVPDAMLLARRTARSRLPTSRRRSCSATRPTNWPSACRTTRAGAISRPACGTLRGVFRRSRRAPDGQPPGTLCAPPRTATKSPSISAWVPWKRAAAGWWRPSSAMFPTASWPSGICASLAEVQRLSERLTAENVYLREEIQSTVGFAELVGQSVALQLTLQQIEQVANTDANVLILGETGTGKELVARAIHQHSARQDRPLIKVDCAALPASLIESELFGYEKGAFTGAEVGRSAASRWPTGVRSSWTKSANCPWSCRRNCCACSKRACSGGWVPRPRRRSTCG